MSIETLSLIWEEIAIKIRYNDNSFEGYKEIQGHGMGHFIIESAEEGPLPITKTGFRSRYIPETIVEDFGDAVGYVHAWLDHGANSKAWKTYIKEIQTPKQLSLF